ncbi:MAG: cytochrome c peroxidase [Myxococcota bacterium]|jgi:cytochrome c peroxidase
MVSLGSILFFDPGLSSNGAVSCATCHKPEHNFADLTPLSRGLGETLRHTPSIVGSQQGPWFYWDGRADSLWSQALSPMEHPNEMAGDRVSIVRYVASHHAERYEKAYGDVPDLSDQTRFPEHARPAATGEQAWMARAWDTMAPIDQAFINVEFARLGKAVGAYESTLMPTEAPFDQYVDSVVAGDASGGGYLTDEQVVGLDVFLGKGQCTLCHNGPLFSDRAFHNNGIPENRPGYDPGRRSGAPLVLGNPFNCRGDFSEQDGCAELDYLDPSFDDFQAAFKTPSLRYVDQTAPYFHNGSHETLDDVIGFYDALPGSPLVGHRELTLKPLDLTAGERAGVVAFLSSLTGAPVQP